MAKGGGIFRAPALPVFLFSFRNEILEAEVELHFRKSLPVLVFCEETHHVGVGEQEIGTVQGGVIIGGRQFPFEIEIVGNENTDGGGGALSDGVGFSFANFTGNHSVNDVVNAGTQVKKNIGPHGVQPGIEAGSEVWAAVGKFLQLVPDFNRNQHLLDIQVLKQLEKLHRLKPGESVEHGVVEDDFSEHGLTSAAAQGG